ncbi:MAG: family 78 glycoside hydrolase catalytic domain [Capsulimonadales bacterium]|nr:family 78 glycoside hydrolase catalytic domain [Capsulimonadales bacterium]
MKITDLRCNALTNPLGIGDTTPLLSWRMETDRTGAKQSAFRIRVATTPDRPETADLWDSGTVMTDQSVFVPFCGDPLVSGQRAYWNVTVTDETGEETVSETAFFEIGLLTRSEWTAQWVGATLAGGPRTTAPAPFLRRAFATGRVTAARLYITALGVYEAYINGKRVGENYLAPGWTDYGKRVQYQVHDVTDLLNEGDNVIGAVLGDGWYCGHIGWRERQWYGDRPKLLGQLVLTLADGSMQVVTTGEDWKFTFGPILEADLLMGETYDARRELGDWAAPGYDDSAWQAVRRFDDPGIELSAMTGPAVRATQELTPIGPPQFMGGWPAGTYIFDMGQNMVGTIRFKLKGKAGDTVRFRFAETLKGGPAATTGPIYTDNLRSAKQTDYYTLKGDPDGEVFEPRFTFHGFRFVEVYGLTEKPVPEDLTGIVLHSEIPQTGDFGCSDPLITRLQSNIDWGLRGNYLDIPTDCPQRDERLGWTGDAQVFVRTAAFNRDVDGFFRKWMRDMRDAQSEAGEFPPFAPNIHLVHSDGGAAWADAGVICPWTIYRCYGDVGILEENYEAMKRFVEFQAATEKDHIRCYDGYQGWMGFGDWLALDGSGKTEGGTPKDLLATAFAAYSAHLLSRAASVLGRVEDAERYEKRFEEIRSAFQRQYVTPAGKVYPGTQTAYVLALRFHLIPDALRTAAVEELVRDIRQRGMKMTTGFVGSSYLPFVLSEAGRSDIAFRLLHQTQWPSFLYAVTQGATTIWERWDGWTHDKGFQDIGMNSFNHYAYGAIGSWLYQVVAGIDLDPEVAGYKRFVLRPHRDTTDKPLTEVSAALDSVYGRIESRWKEEGDQWIWDVTVPPNTQATAYVPLPDDAATVTAEGASESGREAGTVIYSLTPGRFRFLVRPSDG